MELLHSCFTLLGFQPVITLSTKVGRPSTDLMSCDRKRYAWRLQAELLLSTAVSLLQTARGERERETGTHTNLMKIEKLSVSCALRVEKPAVKPGKAAYSTPTWEKKNNNLILISWVELGRCLYIPYLYQCPSCTELHIPAVCRWK